MELADLLTALFWAFGSIVLVCAGLDAYEESVRAS